MQRSETENYHNIESGLECGANSTEPIQFEGDKIVNMIKAPARILAVVALAGLVFGVLSLSKLGSSPAQDVAPPGCSESSEAGGSEPGAAGGNSGVVEGNPGSSAGNSGSAGSGDPNGTVSSVVNPNEGGFEWTLERMLLATPMPMTPEERTFLSKHPPLEKLLDWKQADFDKYISDPLGLRQAADEGVRWRYLTAMLKRQSIAGSKYFASDKFDVPALSESPIGADFDKFDFAQFQAGLKRDPSGGFAKMRQWRQAIKVLAGQVESMRKKASAQGKAEEFEQAIDDSAN